MECYSEASLVLDIEVVDRRKLGSRRLRWGLRKLDVVQEGLRVSGCIQRGFTQYGRELGRGAKPSNLCMALYWPDISAQRGWAGPCAFLDKGAAVLKLYCRACSPYIHTVC